MAGDGRVARTQLVIAVGIMALREHSDMGARLVEGAGVAQVDGACDAAFQSRGRRRLGKVEAGEEFGREEVEVDFAIGAAAVRATVRRDLKLRSVQQHAGEAGAKAANRDLRAFAAAVAVQAHARHKSEEHKSELQS